MRQSDVNLFPDTDCIDDYLNYQPPESERKMSLLSWWQKNKERYPFVYQLARELFAFRVTQVSSESTDSSDQELSVIQQINKDNLAREISYYQKLNKLKSASAKKELEDTRKQLNKAKGSGLSKVDAGPSI